MSNIRALTLPADLLLTATAALHVRAMALPEDQVEYHAKLSKLRRCALEHHQVMQVIEAWTDDEMLNTARTMDLYGGHFASAIARAFYAADSHNRSVLIAAFADLFIKYGPGGPFHGD